jgi:hypothetical protein
MLGPVLVTFLILSFHCAHDFVQGLGAATVSCGVPTCLRMLQSGRCNVPLVRKRRRGGRERDRRVVRQVAKR